MSQTALVEESEKVEVFLRYNKDNIFKNLIQAEDHFRNVKPGFDPVWLNCVVKHLAFAEAEAEEAISHSLSLGKEEQSRRFAELRDEIRKLRRKIQEGKVTSASVGIREVRRLRRLFESFNEEYDVSRCESCGEAVERLIKEIQSVLKPYSPTLIELEREYAEKLLERLSRKYNVPKPKLQIVKSCNDPRMGLHECNLEKREGKIVICEGNINAHVLLHEFGHYLQCLGKLPAENAEEEAEKFALRELGKVKVNAFTPVEVEKPYNIERVEKFGGERSMALTWREVGVIVGGQHIFKGIERAVEEVDVAMGKAAAPVFERPSTWINTVGGLVAVLLPRFVRMPGVIDMLLTVGGGHMTTKLWDYIEEYMATAGGGAAATPAYIPTPSAPTVKSTPTAGEVSVSPTTAAKGKYQVVA